MTRKQLLSAAIAATLTAPSVQALEFTADEGLSLAENTTFNLYGTVEPKVISEKNAAGDASTELGDEDSTLGFAFETRVSNAVTAFGQVELEYDSDDNSNGLDNQDSAFLGVKGDFGKVQAGNFDSVYEDLIIDATEVAEDAEITDEAFAGENNQIAYYSPDWNGFSFRTQARVIGRDEGPEDSNEVGLSIAGGYTGENWGLYAGYDDRKADSTDEYSDGTPIPGADIYVGENTYGVSGIYGIGQLEFGAKYSIQDNLDGDPAGEDTTFTALRGTFFQGRTEYYGAVQRVSPDDETVIEERDEITLGVSHQLYQPLSIWAEAGQYDRPEDEGDQVMVGAIFSF
ncbi:putative porin [Halospina denitrificans]|uniref:Putative porin n=1 Tax=Halospina denitrificans TaxID=332522 RepID=A0A4R7K0E5_9GAMM|nr:porin [Halospina denitrificans]TDT44300.1 putative porin [Halospina denitrificans]